MIVSGVILYLVYGVGARDLGERLEIREKRRKRLARLRARLPGVRRASAEGVPHGVSETRERAG